MNARFLACATALPVLLALHTPAHAVATIETVVSAASLAAGETTVVGTGAVVAGGGAVVKVASTSWWGNLAGDLLVVGGIAIAVLDPPAGTFYSGAFTIHYPSALFAPYQAGWLGDWSETPSDAAPPADPLGFPNGAQFTIHVANPAMQTSTTDPGGLQTTTFDGGRKVTQPAAPIRSTCMRPCSRPRKLSTLGTLGRLTPMWRLLPVLTTT